MRKLPKILSLIKKIKRLDSDAKVARMFGMKENALYERKRMDSIPFEQIITFCEIENVSFDWLVIGKSENEKIIAGRFSETTSLTGGEVARAASDL